MSVLDHINLDRLFENERAKGGTGLEQAQRAAARAREKVVDEAREEVNREDLSRYGVPKESVDRIVAALAGAKARCVGAMVQAWAAKKSTDKTAARNANIKPEERQLYRRDFVDGTFYKAGDLVDFRGMWWVATRDTDLPPSRSNGWRIRNRGPWEKGMQCEPGEIVSIIQEDSTVFRMWCCLRTTSSEPHHGEQWDLTLELKARKNGGGTQ